MTYKEFFDRLENTAKEIENKNTFHGDYKGLAAVLAAGLLTLKDEKERSKDHE